MARQEVALETFHQWRDERRILARDRRRDHRGDRPSWSPAATSRGRVTTIASAIPVDQPRVTSWPLLPGESHERPVRRRVPLAARARNSITSRPSMAAVRSLAPGGQRRNVTVFFALGSGRSASGRRSRSRRAARSTRGRRRAGPPRRPAGRAGAATLAVLRDEPAEIDDPRHAARARGGEGLRRPALLLGTPARRALHRGSGSRRRRCRPSPRRAGAGHAVAEHRGRRARPPPRRRARRSGGAAQFVAVAGNRAPAPRPRSPRAPVRGSSPGPTYPAHPERNGAWHTHETCRGCGVRIPDARSFTVV